MEENREDCIRLGGDFNGRTGEREARNWEEEKWDGKRKSKDKVENAEGKRLMEWIEENHLEIALRKQRGGKEQRRKGKGIGIKLFVFYFFGIGVSCSKKM
jgi:hypothetical protein